MHIEAIQTRPVLPPKDDLLAVLNESLPKLSEKSIVVVSSKVVAIGQGRCVQIPEDEATKISLKERLMKEEAEQYLEKNDAFPFSRVFTVNEGVFGSSSGVDESNGNGWFILLPRGADSEAKRICDFLKERYAVRELGVVIVDSRTVPMRNGVIGIALGHAGFKALFDYRGNEDVFGRKLKYERMNVADCLATAATLVVGEGNEQTPVALVTDAAHVAFVDDDTVDDDMLKKAVPMGQDVFAQFLCAQPWQKNTKDQ